MVAQHVVLTIISNIIICLNDITFFRFNILVFNEKNHMHFVGANASLIQSSTWKSRQKLDTEFFKKNIHELEHDPVTQDINMIFKTWMTSRIYTHSFLV